MADWIQPKTDWTQNDYINVEDFTRIFNNMAYLRDMIATYLGSSVILEGNVLTNERALPMVSSLNVIERNLDALRSVMSSDLLFPATQIWSQPRNPDFTDANRWESFLWKLNQYLNAMALAWHYSGELFVGEI